METYLRLLYPSLLAKFQSLVGSVETAGTGYGTIQKIAFQSLVGSVETIGIGFSLNDQERFQSLVGSVETN